MMIVVFLKRMKPPAGTGCSGTLIARRRYAVQHTAENEMRNIYIAKPKRNPCMTEIRFEKTAVISDQ